MFLQHLHSITSNEHIQNMERLKIQHMSVVYDNADDKLIYDRKLKDGPGTNSYEYRGLPNLMNQSSWKMHTSIVIFINQNNQ